MKVLPIQANAKRIPLPNNSIHCVVTSPPYWGLRDYGSDGQIGLEQSPAEFVDSIIEVFDEVWRVLRDDGTLWLNFGDSYAGSGGAGGDYERMYKTEEAFSISKIRGKNPNRKVSGLKPKDLVGIPWRVAFALQDRGWYLRSDIIWHKPNPMPESVRDRPTKAHEYIFLLSKNKKYFYDQDAIREGLAESTMKDSHPNGTRNGGLWADNEDKNVQGSFMAFNPAGRNKRTVWKIATRSFSGAHFATFPPELPELCIKAGTSEKGVCPECGNPWVREKEALSKPDRTTQEKRANRVSVIPGRDSETRMNSKDMKSIEWKTTGWKPTCDHNLEPVPAVVLDPFLGSGTTAMVANHLGRVGIGTDLSLEYLTLAKERLGMTAMNEWMNGKKVEANLEDLPMFEFKSLDI